MLGVPKKMPRGFPSLGSRGPRWPGVPVVGFHDHETGIFAETFSRMKKNGTISVWNDF